MMLKTLIGFVLPIKRKRPALTSKAFSFNGRGNDPNYRNTQLFEYIEFHTSLKPRIIVEARPLYEQGYTLRQIAKRLGVSKTSVRELLKFAGVDLRLGNHELKKKPRESGAPHICATPYGYCVIKGQLVEVPKEMEIVQLIWELWQKGIPYSAISKHLNSQGFIPRMAKRWDHSTVRSIVFRYRKATNKP